MRALLILVGFSPLLPRLLGGCGALCWIGDAADAWFAFQCHREAGRSPVILGEALPVCWRCFGIYTGLGLGALVLYPKLAPRPLRLWVGVTAALMVLDVLTERLGVRPPWSWMRVSTGILLAYPVGSALVQTAQPQPLGSPRSR